MNDWPLPKELQDLEQQLSALPRPWPSAQLRTAVFEDMRGYQRGVRRRRWYRYAAIAAAVTVVWANLSYRAASATDFRLRGQLARQDTEALESAPDEGTPETSQLEDALRDARSEIAELKAKLRQRQAAGD